MPANEAVRGIRAWIADSITDKSTLGPENLRRYDSLPQILLLPGLHGTADLYQELTNHLSGEWKLVAPEYPRDAKAPYAQLLTMLEFLAPANAPFVLAAESYSTPLAIRFAATLPKNLKGVVLCAGFASSPVGGWLRAAGRLLSPILFRLPAPDFAIDHVLAGSNPPPWLRPAIRRIKTCVLPEVLSARLLEVLECDVREELRKVAVPILYLQAKDDRLVPASCLEEIVRVNPRVAVETIEGPHLLFQREPERTAGIVKEFARKVFAEA